MDFKEQYQKTFSQVTASELTRRRIETMANGKFRKKQTRRAGRIAGKILLAAVLVSLLAVTASAATSGDLFQRFFEKNAQKPLSENEIAYIEENEQPSVAVPQPTQTPPESGYSVSVRSAITDGKTAYITVGVTAPEGVVLDDAAFLSVEEPLLFPDTTEGLEIAPDGSSPDALCDYEAMEDGDGLPNTHNIVFKVNPFLKDSSIHPFDGHVQWTMSLKGLSKTKFIPDGTGKGTFEDYPLSEDQWEFLLSFQPIDVKTVEFLPEPKTMMASKWLQEEYNTEVILKSLALSGLHFDVVIEPKEGVYDKNDPLDIGDVDVVMKDGSSQKFLRICSCSYSLDVPIVLEDVDYLLLSDGTKLYNPS